MLSIPCPWCGPRDEIEFTYGREADVAYPKDPYALSDEEWAKFLFYRDNTMGLLAEQWNHHSGCRRWFKVLRDTVTYDIKASYTLDSPEPVIS